MTITQKELEELQRDAKRWRAISEMVETVRPNFSHYVRGKTSESNGQFVSERLPVYTVDLRFVGDSFKNAVDDMVKQSEMQSSSAPKGSTP